jgi:tRNA threonylcarbamoyladenosine biosynthesis protein TsaB
VGIGPGSYTGIRAAIAMAQGWQLATNVKLLGISSVEAMAAEAQSGGIEGKVHVAIDAQRGEFYLATYSMNEKGFEESEKLALVGPTKVKERVEAGGILIGPEIEKWFSVGRVLFPRAARVGELALSRRDYVAGEELEPIYLRETAFVKAPPSRVLPE